MRPAELLHGLLGAPGELEREVEAAASDPGGLRHRVVEAGIFLKKKKKKMMSVEKKISLYQNEKKSKNQIQKTTHLIPTEAASEMIATRFLPELKSAAS